MVSSTVHLISLSICVWVTVALRGKSPLNTTALKQSNLNELIRSDIFQCMCVISSKNYPPLSRLIFFMQKDCIFHCVPSKWHKVSNYHFFLEKMRFHMKYGTKSIFKLCTYMSLVTPIQFFPLIPKFGL